MTDDYIVRTGDFSWHHDCPDNGGRPVVAHQVRVYSDGSMQLYCPGCQGAGDWVQHNDRG